MQILHAADLHVGARPYQLEGLQRIFLEAFDEIVALAVRERVSALLIAGDLFDRPRPGNDIVRRVARGLRRLSDKGIPVVAAHGEHDTPGRRESTVLQLLSDLIDGFHAPRPSKPGPEGVAETILEVGGLTVAVYPLVKADPRTRKQVARRLLPLYSKLLESRPGRRVFLAHVGLAEVVGCPAPDPEDCPFDLGVADLPPVDYAALGHIHKRWVGGGGRVPRAAYPGSVFPKDIVEARDRFPRGPLLVDLSGDEPTVQEAPLDIADYTALAVDVPGPRAVARVIGEALEEAARRLAGARHRVVFLEAYAPPEVPVARLEKEAARRGGELGLTVALRTVRVAGVPGEGRAKTASLAESLGVVDPAALISASYGVSKRTAQLILELKEALLESPHSPRVLEILDALYEQPDYQALIAKMLRGR